MALEDLLREAAAKGLTHLSLHPVPSEDGRSTFWRATATPSTQHKYVSTANYDPAEAVRVVLEALPRAPRRSAPKKGLDQHPLGYPDGIPHEPDERPTEAVTAAVNPGDPVDLHDGPNDEFSRFKI